jgi:hypothetical protein
VRQGFVVEVKGGLSKQGERDQSATAKALLSERTRRSG